MAANKTIIIAYCLFHPHDQWDNNCKITFGVDSKFSGVLECLEYHAYHARIWAYYQSLAGSIECKGCGLFDGKWESYTYIPSAINTEKELLITAK